jgi:hypothetical protein
MRSSRLKGCFELSHKFPLRIKISLLVAALGLLIFTLLYFINDFQIASEQEESYQDFLERGEEIDQWINESELSNQDAEIRSQQLLDSDAELIERMNDMDSNLGITPDEFKNEYPGIGGK